MTLTATQEKPSPASVPPPPNATPPAAVMASLERADAALRERIAKAVARPVVIELVDESPFHRRRVWGNLDELAASIKGLGVFEDMVGRPHPAKKDRIELVFGHRRLRGSKKADAPTVPIKVVDLTDDQVVQLQIAENLQREDNHPIEEAETFELLRAKEHLSVDQLAARVHKSKEYVYASLKLLELVPEARTAFVEGVIVKEVALYIARMPKVLQAKALKDLAKKDWNGEVPSARAASRMIREKFMLKLAEAPFDRGDASLVPSAGACEKCPHRTGSQPELFADVDSKDICTNPPCFEAKSNVHQKNEEKRLAEKGVRVVRSVEKYGYVEAPDGFTPLDRPMYTEGLPEKSRGKTLGALLRAAKVKVEIPKAVYFDGDGKAVPVVEDASKLLKAAGVIKKAPAEHREKPRSKEQIVEDKAKREAAEEIEATTIGALITAIERKGVNDGLLRFVIAPYDYKGAAKKLTGNKLAAFVARCLLEEDPGMIGDGGAQELAKAYGVDVKAIEKHVLAKRAPAAAAKDGKVPATEIAKATKAAAKKVAKAAVKKGRKK